MNYVLYNKNTGYYIQDITLYGRTKVTADPYKAKIFENEPPMLEGYLRVEVKIFDSAYDGTTPYVIYRNAAGEYYTGTTYSHKATEAMAFTSEYALRNHDGCMNRVLLLTGLPTPTTQVIGSTGYGIKSGMIVEFKTNNNRWFMRAWGEKSWEEAGCTPITDPAYIKLIDKVWHTPEEVTPAELAAFPMISLLWYSIPISTPPKSRHTPAMDKIQALIPDHSIEEICSYARTLPGINWDTMSDAELDAFLMKEVISIMTHFM